MTTSPRVVIADPVTEEFEKRWRDSLAGMNIDLVFIKDELLKNLHNTVSGARAIITKRIEVDASLLDAAGPRLMGVIKLSNWPLDIDQQACAQRDVVVKLLRQFGGVTVAEQAMTLLLACSRQLLLGHIGVAKGRYIEFGLEPAVTAERSFAPWWIPIRSFELYRRTLGIIGMGEIGRELALRARAFSMNILYYKRRRLPAWCEEDLGVVYSEIPELLEKSDFVSLHLPHTPETEKLIGRAEFERMRRTAYLINTARGGVVDQEALVSALETRQIAGAGLDVFAVEPVPYDDPLLKLDNVVFSPHAGGGSRMSRVEQARDVRRSLKEILKIEETASDDASWENALRVRSSQDGHGSDRGGFQPESTDADSRPC